MPMLKKDFIKAAKKAEGMSDSAFLDAIMAERPDLARETAYVPEQGQCAHAVIIGDEVFKTARFDSGSLPEMREYCVAAIERERNIYQHLKDKGLPVPEVTYEGQAFPFFGMTRLPGQCLTPDDLEKMPEDDKVRLAKELGALCADLSAVASEDDVKIMNVQGWPFGADKYSGMFSDPRVKKMLGDDYNFCRQAVHEYIDRHQEKYADGRKYLMHGDLHPGNILYDPKTKKLSGLIDFGSSRFTWPENGFNNFFMTFPRDFVDVMLKEYSRCQPVQVTLRDMQLWGCVMIASQITTALGTHNEPWKNYIKGSISSARREIETSRTGKPSVCTPRRGPRIA